MANEAVGLERRGALDFFRGFGIPFRALGMVFSTPRLRSLTLAVAAITGLTLIALAIGLWHGAPALVDWLWTAPDSWWGPVVRFLLVASAFGLGLVAGANTLPLIIAAPLMDPISVAAERALGHPVEEAGGVGRFVKEILGSLFGSVLRLAVFVAGAAVLLPLLVVPVIGGPAFTALSWVWSSVWVAGQYLDVPMARHLYPFRAQLAVLKGRVALCLGFGAAVSLMLWVPLLNFFFVPVAVVAGTVMFRGLVGSRDIPDLTAGAPAAPLAQRQS